MKKARPSALEKEHAEDAPGGAFRQALFQCETVALAGDVWPFLFMGSLVRQGSKLSATGLRAVWRAIRRQVLLIPFAPRWKAECSAIPPGSVSGMERGKMILAVCCVAEACLSFPGWRGRQRGERKSALPGSPSEAPPSAVGRKQAEGAPGGHARREASSQSKVWRFPDGRNVRDSSVTGPCGPMDTTVARLPAAGASEKRLRAVGPENGRPRGRSGFRHRISGLHPRRGRSGGR